MIENDVQQKIFEILDADATLNAKISSRIYDLPPEDTIFPYVVIGNDTFEPWDTHDSIGFTAELAINVWTQSGGRKDAKELNGLIYNLLHDKDLLITGSCTISLKRSFVTTMIEEDGSTIQGISKYNLIIGV